MTILLFTAISIISSTTKRTAAKTSTTNRADRPVVRHVLSNDVSIQ